MMICVTFGCIITAALILGGGVMMAEWLAQFGLPTIRLWVSVLRNQVGSSQKHAVLVTACNNDASVHSAVNE